jgi:raffinose/stachyose/melibiose transport system substrate-binding protein
VPAASLSPALSRRNFLSALGAAGATIALSACSGGPGGSARQTITFYQSKPEAIPYFGQLARDFTESQSDYRILHDISTNLSASFVRRNPPDLGCLNYNLEMGRFMERGALADLAGVPAAQTIRDDVLDLSTAYASYEGRTSVIPYSVTAASVIYNKRIFADNGLDVPTTWDAMLDVCERLKAAGIPPIYSTYRDPWTVAQGLFDYTVGGMIDVRAFYEDMNRIGADVGPDSEVSFQRTLLEPVKRMLQLAAYSNDDAASRGYGDGNTAFANGQAAMYFQGPWALGEVEKAGTDIDLGTFPLPMTDDPADLKVRVNIDLSLWIPEVADGADGARAFLEYLMQPEVQNAYNAEFLAFGTTKDAPPVADPRILEMQGYYDDSRFYMGASQFIPNTIPAANYLQAMVNGDDPQRLLARMDSDWSRLAFRQ